MSLPTRRLGLSALVALATAAFAPALDQPAFAPAADSSVTKTFAYGGDFSLDEFSALIDGQDILGMLFGSIEVTLELESEITVTDTYLASEDGRPVKLKRSFDAISGETNVAMNSDLGDESQDMSSSSDLEGRTVLFHWNDEEEGFDVSFDGDEGDEALLDGLVEDMDLRALLPQGEVSEGDTWNVELSELEDIAWPGGDTGLRPEDLGDDEAGDAFEEVLGDDYSEYIDDLFEGTCVCTYKGTEDGLAEIHVAIEIGSAADLSDMMTEVLEGVGESMGEAPPITIELADLNLDFEGEGVLLWDLEAGRIGSFELTADLILALDVGLTASLDGQAQSAELTAEISGTYDYKVGTEE